jgi:hypothetical protein
LAFRWAQHVAVTALRMAATTLISVALSPLAHQTRSAEGDHANEPSSSSDSEARTLAQMRQ